MVLKIHHLGIAVNDLDQAARILKEAFGLELSGVEEVTSQKVKVAFIPIGETRFELLQPTVEDSAVAKFLASRGEGLHHIALLTDDVRGEIARCEQAGLKMIDREPRAGAHGTKVAFIHPKSTFGTMFELVEEPERETH